jgi:phage terminase small subunit
MELTPQQQAFLKNYLSPKSETWSNAYQSALKAGYSKEYSENITSQMPDWLSENLGDNALLSKALANLSEALEGELDEEGRSKQIKYKATEFTLKSLNKDKFSERTEHTGKDGKDLIPDKQSEEKANQAINLFLNGEHKGDTK